MNIYLYEMKSQARNFIIWTVSMLLTMVLFMGGMYPIYANSAVEIEKMMEGFPKGFLEVFGFNIENMFSYQGFYSFSYVYIGIVAAIMAVSVSLSIFGREKKMKCLDFIFTKPVSRAQLFLMKTMAALSIVVATNVIFIVGNLIAFYQNGQKSEGLGQFVLASFSVFFTQLVFISIGAFLGTFMKKIRSVSGIATAAGFISFILTALANLTGKEEINYISPLHYFDPAVLVKTGHYETKFIIIAVLVVAFCMGTSYIRYCKGDVHAA